MTKEWSLFFASIAVMLVSAAAIAVAVNSKPPVDMGSWADWAAATGTTAGVFAAIWTVTRGERDRRQAANTVVKAMLALVVSAKDDVESIKVSFQGKSDDEIPTILWTRLRVGRIKNYYQALDVFDASILPTVNSLEMLMEARGSLRMLFDFDITIHDSKDAIVRVDESLGDLKRMLNKSKNFRGVSL